MTGASAATTPSSRYRQKLADGFTPDPVQERAVSHLDALHAALVSRKGLFGRGRPARGLYLHGQVGIGKTFLMDLFYGCLPAGRKKRLHFHQFMQDIHLALKAQSGHKDPLARIGRELARDIDVLCLDELFITDVADAMIVYRLLESLFSQGVVLVTTSNFPPDKLYRDDLQPALFQPAIELITAHTTPLHLASHTDYRLLGDKAHKAYFINGEQDFNALFSALHQGRPGQAGVLDVEERPLEAVSHGANLAWFTFEVLCQGPRSQRDYLALSRRFDTILVSGIPQLTRHEAPDVPPGIEEGEGAVRAGGRARKTFTLEDNAIRRFISLVDVLYDNGNLLYLSAAVPLDELYQGDALRFEFQRTRSRLIDMEGADYRQRARG